MLWDFLVFHIILAILCVSQRPVEFSVAANVVRLLIKQQGGVY